MNLIFIEAKNANTSECNFLKTILSKHFADKSVEFICMNGVGNLFQKSIINRMEQAQVEGDSVLVMVDADSPSKDGDTLRGITISRLKRHNCS